MFHISALRNRKENDRQGGSLMWDESEHQTELPFKRYGTKKDRGQLFDYIVICLSVSNVPLLPF